MSYVEELGRKAKAAESFIAAASTMQKNNALSAISKALIENAALIISENSKDLEAAAQNGMSAAMQDRLRLDERELPEWQKVLMSLSPLMILWAR